jgi:hypothetical protein
LKYEAGGKDLIAEDYTTGTITTLANGSTALTASGTTFTSAMAGRYIYLPDGNWYKIAAFLTTTTLTLDKAYEGISIAAGTDSFIVGQIPRVPNDTQTIPVNYAVWQYYKGFKQNTNFADDYKKMFDEELAVAKETYGRRYSSKYIPSRMNTNTINPNSFPFISEV